jgi:hypothetical protein
MSVYGVSPGQTPQQALASFVWTLYDDLDYVVAIRDNVFIGPAMTDVLDALRDAWAPVLSRRSELTNAVLAAPMTGLEAAGLTEPMLGFKLMVWRRARNQLAQQLDADPGAGPAPPAGPPAPPPPTGVTPDPPLRRKIPRWVKRFLKRLAQALSYADTLLGSLASVVNLAEILKEIKEFVEKLADDTADELPDEPAT